MKNFYVLTEAIEYIEKNLYEAISRKQVADHCYVSLSMLEKLFRYALKHSIREYITKRKITQAAFDLSNTELSIMDIAMKYHFNSHEVFSRSFKHIWNISPSEFTRKWRFTGLFPKINYKYQEGDDLDMARKKVDLSDAYDFFNQHRGTYVICFDISGLLKINEISLKAGDLAILEAAARINEVATEDMLLIRIGGDEFALVTVLSNASEAKQLANKVMAMNGKPILYNGKEIPLSLYAGIITIPASGLRYSEFFANMHCTINESKKVK